MDFRHITHRKAPASPHTTITGGGRSGQAPGHSEGERGRRESGRMNGGWIKCRNEDSMGWKMTGSGNSGSGSSGS